MCFGSSALPCLTQLKEAASMDRWSGVQGGLPLDGFHQRAGLSIDRARTFAVVNRKSIVRFRDNRGIDRDAYPVQTSDVSKSRDSQRLGNSELPF